MSFHVMYLQACAYVRVFVLCISFFSAFFFFLFTARYAPQPQA
jgi:hypothetical protein